MADTKNVIPQLDLSGSDTKLLTIIANERGAADAVAFDQVTYLGFPFRVRNLPAAQYQQQHPGVAGQGIGDSKPVHSIGQATG